MKHTKLLLGFSLFLSSLGYAQSFKEFKAMQADPGQMCCTRKCGGSGGPETHTCRVIPAKEVCYVGPSHCKT